MAKIHSPHEQKKPPTQSVVRKSFLFSTIQKFEQHMRGYIADELEKQQGEYVAKLALSFNGYHRTNLLPLLQRIAWLETPWYVRRYRVLRSWATSLRYPGPVVSIEDLAPTPPPAPTTQPEEAGGEPG
ncbi:MAG: hypothetical protein AB7Q29_16050 [Vicinamibacterales bacterium]